MKKAKNSLQKKKARKSKKAEKRRLGLGNAREWDERETKRIKKQLSLA